MITKSHLGGGAAIAVGVLALAGCGASQVSHHSKMVAAKLLSNANSSALATSFKMDFRGRFTVSLTGVTGLPSATLLQVQKVESEMNSASMQGSIEFQSPSDFEVIYSFAPFLSQPLQVIDVGGSEYASFNGTQWHAIGTGAAGSSASGQIPSQLANLPEELRSLGTAAQGATTITTLPNTTLDGVAVDHVRAVVSGAGLDKIFTSALGALGSGASSSGLGSEATALSQLIHFDSAQSDTYIAINAKLPKRETASGGMSFNLAALSLLSSAQAPKVAGTFALNFALAVDYSDYGSHFAITKPSDVVAGPLTLPSSTLDQLP